LRLRLRDIDPGEVVVDAAHGPRKIVVTVDHWLPRHGAILPLAAA
jgi:hypothetical protein